MLGSAEYKVSRVCIRDTSMRCIVSYSGLLSPLLSLTYSSSTCTSNRHPAAVSGQDDD